MLRKEFEVKLVCLFFEEKEPLNMQEMDRSYTSLLTPRGQIEFKNQKEFLKKIPPDCERHFIFDKYLDIEDDNDIMKNGKCHATMIILTGIHNETINIYSHLIPMIIICIEMIIRFIIDHHKIDYMLPLNCYGISMICAFLFSVYYHCGCCISPSKYHQLLQVDLFGVYLCFFVSVLSGVYIGFDCNPFLKLLYSFINVIIFIFILFPILFIYGNIIKFWIKKWLFITLLICELIPLFHWIYLYYPLLKWFWYGPVGMFGGYFIGGLIWHYRIPEVFAPGKFDVFGHSHQWWHLFIVIASFTWWYALHDLAMFWQTQSCIDHKFTL